MNNTKEKHLSWCLFLNEKNKNLFVLIVLLSLQIFNEIMAIETPEYNLLEKEGKFELRVYNSFVVARTRVQNDYREATVAGFRKVANYIFGGNERQLSIAMTAPVISNVPNEEGVYNIVFVMPREHALSSLPAPNDNQVKLEEHNLGRTAVVRFGGWATKSRADYYKKELIEFLRKKEYVVKNEFFVAQYNSPWALPPFRKNEIIVSIE